MSTVRLLDIEKGEWLHSYNAPSGPVAPNALSCPHDDYVLIDNRLLVHMPTKIQVCEYRDAGQIATVGDTALIAMLADSGGLLAPGNFRTRRRRRCWRRLNRTRPYS